MKLLVTYFLAVVLIANAVQEDVNAEICVFDKLESEDSKFCKGDLEVSYPELGDVGCSYIPNCYEYRKQISKEWNSPSIRYNRADKNKQYILIMVDPDAPSRARPKHRYWRHWVVVDIRGADLKNGKLQGRVLTDYARPTPPAQSGYHRYQFLLFEQPAREAIALSPDEAASSGTWNMRSFVGRLGLGRPVASTQFLTRHCDN